MKKVLIVLFLLMSVSNAREIVLGIVPQQSPMKLIKVWRPIAKYLSEVTGVKVVFKTEKSIPHFENRLYHDAYDIAYVNPYHFVVASQKAHYRARVRATKNIVGILVAQKKRTLSEIMKANPTFLFPAPNAFAATLLTKYELIQLYGRVFDNAKRVRYVNSHDSVYKGVARGIGDIGGGIVRTFKAFSDVKAKDKLQIIYKTKPYPSHPFVFSQRVDKNLESKLVNALIAMPEALKKALKVEAFKRIDDREFESVQALSKELQILPVP